MLKRGPYVFLGIDYFSVVGRMNRLISEFVLCTLYQFIIRVCTFHSKTVFGLRVCASTFTISAFSFFFFFQAAIVDQIFHEQCLDALFMDPQITLFNNFFIKNGSHNTIYTFKNYFTTVFSVSVFSFSKNKFNSNRLKRDLSNYLIVHSSDWPKTGWWL